MLYTILLSVLIYLVILLISIIIDKSVNYKSMLINGGFLISVDLLLFFTAKKPLALDSYIMPLFWALGFGGAYPVLRVLMAKKDSRPKSIYFGEVLLLLALIAFLISILIFN